ncbi:MAG: hypothetical protein EBR09_14475 [Proteobacteria bacterium]|nr:hypothetical protein [Pseudomonadota bacterium]
MVLQLTVTIGIVGGYYQRRLLMKFKLIFRRFKRMIGRIITKKILFLFMNVKILHVLKTN